MQVKIRRTEFLNAAYLWNLVFGMTLLVYAVGLFITIMEPDAAIYAQVSMEMHDRGDYLSIYHKGVDWLDKPHFPFWMSALSFEVFGVNNFAYKLPAILFVLLGAYYTYLFAKRFYGPLHGWIAVIILLTAEHIIISNQDVRAEPFMTGLMIMGLYHFAVMVSGKDGREEKKLWLHMTLGSLAVACLIMTKGLFTIIPIASGIGLSLLYQKNWRQIFSWHWLVVAVMVVIFLSPALYGYYRQFDLHPEKTVFGQKGVSGVEFFLWTSQWGRFTNTGPITGKGDITFFVHTLLWAFLPWAFAAFFALYHKTRDLIKGITVGENFSYFGFITLFLIFSASKFQLSFYLNPLFPLLAVVTTHALLSMSKKALKVFTVIHIVLCSMLVVGLVLLHYFFSGGIPNLDSLVVVLLGVLIAFYLFRREGMYLKKVVFATAIVVLSVNYYVNRDFYPALLEYQAESEIAYHMRDNGISAERVVFVGEMQSIADVIMHAPTQVVREDSVRMEIIADKYVFTTIRGREKIDSLGIRYMVIGEYADFPVTRLTGKFINRKTRHKEVQLRYFLKVGWPETQKPVIQVSQK